ncbi:MAG TPA: SDR family oxidoreductase [Patescibacteria group bacterium]|nr:SDR family oxidoreductase [Patescibacteria group bacterium]
MDIVNKTVLITGGARIGHFVALALAKKGAHIAMTYLQSKDKVQKTVDAVQALGQKATLFQADVSRDGESKKMIESVVKKFGSIDVLVNMASVYKPKPMKNLEAKDWDTNIGANLKSGYLCSLEASKGMLKNGAGKIINFSDWSSLNRPYKDFLPYHIAKGAVLPMTLALAAELAPAIQVNCIAPGPILPPADFTKKQIEEVADATPLKRWGGPEEIVKAVLYLIDADFVTGQCLYVDGGRHLG